MSIRDFLITMASYIRRPAKRALIRFSYSMRSRKGLEIGGPSSIFSLKGYIPVYLFANAIDGVNYSNTTVWEGSIKEGNFYKWHNKTGHQFIREATDLSVIPDNTYGFILSSHSLEHVANPLLALKEWSRVLKPNGTIVLVLPDKHHTFDINRPFTNMAHLLDDYAARTGEDDTTHFDEVIANLVPEDDGRSREETIDIIRDNARLRCVHHHVFSQELVKEMFDWLDFSIIHQAVLPPHHICTIAQKK